jgi:uncharacterized protein (DUF433 family)
MHYSSPFLIDPEINGGQPVFAGTRIPVEMLFDYLRVGVSLRDFLLEFPSVSADQAAEVLKMMHDPKSLVGQILGKNQLKIHYPQAKASGFNCHWL